MFKIRLPGITATAGTSSWSRLLTASYCHYFPCRKEFTVRRPSSSTVTNAIRLSSIVNDSLLQALTWAQAVFKSCCDCTSHKEQLGFSSAWSAFTTPTTSSPRCVPLSAICFLLFICYLSKLNAPYSQRSSYSPAHYYNKNISVVI